MVYIPLIYFVPAWTTVTQHQTVKITTNDFCVFILFMILLFQCVLKQILIPLLQEGGDRQTKVTIFTEHWGWCAHAYAGCPICNPRL